MNNRSRRAKTTWFEPGRADWQVAVLFMVGTILFNVSTFAALRDWSSAAQATHRIWIPNAEAAARQARR